MNQNKFVQTLGRNFSRQRLIEAHLMSVRETREQTLPMYKGFLEHIKPNLLSAGSLGRQSKDFFHISKPYQRSKNMFEHVSAVLNAVVEMSGEIEDEITRAISKTDSAESLSYKAVNLAQLVQVFQFSTTYARKFLLQAAQQIQATVNKPTVPFESALSEPEQEWMQANYLNFAHAIECLSMVATNFKKAMEEIPDVIVSLADSGAVANVHGNHLLDPFGLTNVGSDETKSKMRSGFIFASPAYSIIYHVRMFIADYQIDRYESAKEERQALEWRIQALTDSLAGESNPKLETAINHHNGRLMSINRKIAKMEADINERS